jgi:23S rRNA pseudouridine1911/1915/1917 synthase
LVVSPGSRVHQFVVGPDEAGVRLDVLVVRHVAALGRRGVRSLFERGGVLSDGRVAKKGQVARSGAEVTVHLGPADVALPEPGAPLQVLLETDQMLIVDKPAGQPTAVIEPGGGGTLVNALLGRYPELSGVGYGPREPGIIHRLDTQTSGVVIAARTADAFERLTRALKSGALDKRYLAVVERFGLPAEGWIDEPLAPHPRRADRVVVARDLDRGRPATTHFRRVQTPDPAGRWALLELRVERAQRHQIRAHLAHLGHPIAGDGLYGGPPAPELGERHALHASYVAWAGDDCIDAFAAEAPLPAEMAGLVGR